MSTNPGSPPRAASFVGEEFGITLRDSGSAVGLTMNELIEVGLRRNPKRAQLLVSTVLGKHLAADPRVVAGMGRLLGALVGRALARAVGPAPATWSAAAAATITGSEPGALLTLLAPGGDAGACTPGPLLIGGAPLTIGFAETATALGHLVADQLGSAYLHSTRRRDGAVPNAAEFTEPHSHATGHLLRPDPKDLLDGDGPVVLVDDELSTGRTALNVIAALQRLAPRSRYILAGLVDVRSPDDDRNRVEVAERLGCRIDVVALVRGAISVPDGSVDRVAAELAPPDGGVGGGAQSFTPQHPAPEPLQGRCSRVELRWPADVPSGGRHGFGLGDRPAFEAATRRAAGVLSLACKGYARVLVLGTEELMYLPLRLALELARDPLHAMAVQSTTRSPVHVLDRPGYPLRRRIDYRSAVLGAPDLGGPGSGEPGRVQRYLYNAAWPGAESTGSMAADLIVVVDDGHAVPGPDGIAAAIAAVTGTPVLLAVLTPRPAR